MLEKIVNLAGEPNRNVLDYEYCQKGTLPPSQICLDNLLRVFNLAVNITAQA
jgi:hypothetical protein